MAQLTGTDRERYVQGMFTRIASRYDLMNRLMTFGQDRRWRKEVIQRAEIPGERSLILDLGGGTGDLGLEALKRHPTIIPIETDFTLEMMRVGRERPGGDTLQWSAADALTLPYPDGSFEAVISGFLLRNVVDLPAALREQLRVLKSGGRMVALDTTPPQISLLRPFVSFHMNILIPFLGRIITGQDDAYVYLPESTQRFLTAEELAVHMAVVGFEKICFERLNFGTIAIHWGDKGL